MLTKLLESKCKIFLILLASITILSSDELVIEIDNPKFSEKGLNDRIYEIKANKGLKSNDSLELFLVVGKFKTENNGKWVYLEADKGNFIQASNFIILENNIKFYTEDGETVKSDLASFDMEQDMIILQNNVRHESPSGLILSDNSTITNNFSNIVYKGNVTSVINN